MSRIGIIAVMLVGLLAASVHADVVELKNGQRIEGTLKQADQSTVSIEVGGQVITFKSEQVRAIYYGSAPSAVSPPTSNPASEALRALKTLQSVAGGGVSYRDYGPRVTDAKIVVDRYLETPASGDEALRTAIGEALGFFTLAYRAWEGKIANGSGPPLKLPEVGKNPLLNQCPQFQAVLPPLPSYTRTKDPIKDAIEVAGWMGYQAENALPALWACASDRIAVAEKAMK